MASEAVTAPELSIVVPVYNEADSLPEFHTRLKDVLSTLTDRHEIIFVDDGSSDRSFEVLEQLQEPGPGVTVVQLRRNFGKAAALATGFREARGQLVVTIDSDLQDQPEEIPKLLDRLKEGYDLVAGWRVKRRDSFRRVLASKIFNRVGGWLTGVRLHDMNCGLKAFRREVIEELVIHGGTYRFIPAIAHFKGFTVGEVAIEHQPRRHGASKYGADRYLGSFFDLMTVVMITRFLRRPLHLFGPLGLVTTAAGVGILVYLVAGWLMGLWWLGDRPLLLVGIMLTILGVLVTLFGLLAELISYVDRGHEEVSVRKTIRSDGRQGPHDPAV